MAVLYKFTKIATNQRFSGSTLIDKSLLFPKFSLFHLLHTVTGEWVVRLIKTISAKASCNKSNYWVATLARLMTAEVSSLQSFEVLRLIGFSTQHTVKIVGFPQYVRIDRR